MAVMLKSTVRVPSLFSTFLSRSEKSVSKNRVLGSYTFGDNNPITASFIATAFEALGHQGDRSYRFAIQQVLEWATQSSIHMPARGYPALLADEALSRVGAHLGRSVGRRAAAARKRIAAWSYVELTQQLSFFHSDHSYFDVAELPFVMLLACKGDQVFWTSPLVTDAVAALFEAQSSDGLWHTTKPFWYSAGRGYFVASSQIMSAILRILLRRQDLYCIHEKLVSRYVSWLENNIAEAKLGGSTIDGWSAEADHSRGRLELFITLENLRALRLLKRIIADLNRDDLLRRSGVSVKWEPMAWSKLSPVDLAQPEKDRIATKLLRLFIEPYKQKKKLGRCSIVLYGPPGTSKTTIAEVLADALGDRHKPWPFVTITPGDFIAGGEPMQRLMPQICFAC